MLFENIGIILKKTSFFRSMDKHHEIQLLKLGLAVSILVIRTCLALVEYIKSSSLEGQDKDIAAS